MVVVVKLIVGGSARSLALRVGMEDVLDNFGKVGTFGKGASEKSESSVRDMNEWINVLLVGGIEGKSSVQRPPR